MSPVLIETIKKKSKTFDQSSAKQTGLNGKKIYK
jgi:hypothetical protein